MRISSATALSRALGLVREVVIAHEFGASAAYDAYLIAFFLPHLWRKLLAEGALSLAFVPLYTQRLLQGRAQADQFASTVLSVAFVGFPLLILAGIGLAPWLVRLLADGFTPQQQALTVHLSRITFPFIGLVGLASIVMGVLNAQHRFVLPALAPVLFNVGMIASVLAFRSLGADALALGVLVGGTAQLGVQLPALRGRWRFRWRLRLQDPALRQLGTLMLPAVLGLAVVQINVLVDNKLASHLGQGAISALQYAIRLFQLPLGVFAVAISTAILPRLSASAIQDEAQLLTALRRGVMVCTGVLVPATVGLWVLGEPIIRLLFEHGAFTAPDTARTLNALTFYALGLLPYGWLTVMTRAFYALKDGRTPVTISIMSVAVNVVLALLLVGPMGVGGLALATALAGWLQWGLAWAALRRRLSAPLGAGLARPTLATALAAGLMGGGIWLFGQALQRLTQNELALVAFPIGVGLGIYGGLGWRWQRKQLSS